MFSIITIASSTTKPVAMVSAIRLRLSSEKPSRYITAKVPTKEIGTTTAGISVARQLRRNRNTTITTSPTASTISTCTSFTDARMVCVRSPRICTSTEAGKAFSSCGNKSLMRSATSITLAPGWRCTLRIIAGCPLAQAPKRVFSAASITCATSPSRTTLF